MISVPTAHQVLAATVRAAVEAYYLEHRKPLGGGFVVPPREEVWAAVAKKTGVREAAISLVMTFSRSCSHPWSRGACPRCPPADHIPF